MNVLSMTIVIERKVYGLAREDEFQLRVTWPDGTSCLNRNIACREACYGVALRIAHHAYGEDRAGRVNATNSMVFDIANDVERVAGC